MKPGPDIAVVIATHRRSTLLRRTLESLAAPRRPEMLREVLVVENGGAHGARTIVEAFAGRLPVRYLLLEDGNKCRALNLGLAEASSELICFFDDDVRLAESIVETYADAGLRYGRGHHFSGPLVAEWETPPPDWLLPWLPPSARGWDKGEDECFYDEPHFIGSNWAAFREDVLAVGGFDERIGPGSPTGAIGDERDLQERLLAAGGRGVYLPDARVWHHVPTGRIDFEWTRHRQYVTGFTCGLMGWPLERGVDPTGVSGGLRQAVKAAKIAVAKILGWGEERRAWLEMTHALGRGYRDGRRARRRAGQPERHRTPSATGGIYSASRSAGPTGASARTRRMSTQRCDSSVELDSASLPPQR